MTRGSFPSWRSARDESSTAARIPRADSTPKDWMVTGPSERLGSSNHGMTASGSGIGTSVYSPGGARTTEKRPLPRGTAGARPAGLTPSSGGSSARRGTACRGARTALARVSPPHPARLEQRRAPRVCSSRRRGMGAYPRGLAALAERLFPDATVVRAERLLPDAAVDPSGEGEKAIGYSEPLKVIVRDRDGRTHALVFRTEAANEYGHDRRADRVEEAILAFDVFGEIPGHARALDVGLVGADGRLVSLRETG